MAAPASPAGALGPTYARYTELTSDARAEAERDCRALTDEIYQGLDLTGEIRTVAARGLGDALLLRDGSGRLDGFAVCHWGPASEAGQDCLFVKFGAVRSGAGAEARFAALLNACATLAGQVGMSTVLAGVSTGREAAYRLMLSQGFRARMHVVTMHRPNEPGYSRPDCFVLDDWR